MKISTIIKSSSIVCIILSASTLGLMFAMNISIDKERQYVQRQLEFRQLGHDLGQASDFLTREARRYTIFGDKRHYDAYWKEVKETRTRDKVVERLKALSAPPEELALIEKAKANSDALIATEDKAMKAASEGNLEYARTLMFDENYDRDKAIIMAPIQEFEAIMNARAEKEARETREKASILQQLTNAVIFSYVILVLVILYSIFLRKVSYPLGKMTDAIDAIAKGETNTEIPFTNVNNEIGNLAQSAELFKQSLIKNKNLATDLKQHKENLEKEVADRTRDLTEANDELEEFAYRTSHDLRSPIISSMKLLHMAQKSIDTEQPSIAKKSIQHAQNSLQKLEALIGDILTLTETKNREEYNQEVDISQIVDDAIEKIAFMDGADQIDIRKNLSFTEKLWIKKSRFTLILENLLSNAIKYQDPKKQNPYVQISTQEEDQHLILEVIDNGLGIPQEQEKNLFAMFKRFHPKISFGSGLGLYMMKKSANILNGEISFRNNGEGSTFRLRIPLEQ